VRSNETLFNKGKLLGNHLSTLLSSIVQNDMYIEKTELKRWVNDIQTEINKVIIHGETIVNYIQNKMWDEKRPWKGQKVEIDNFNWLTEEDEGGMKVADNIS
jgi:hypothetical protein